MTRSIDDWLRGIAGTFVLASLALGWFVHPGFFLFTAFVGANLLQSAFTGHVPDDVAAPSGSAWGRSRRGREAAAAVVPRELRDDASRRPSFPIDALSVSNPSAAVRPG